MKSVFLFAALVTASIGAACADETACEKIAKQADKDQAHFFPREGFRVAGKGRLYFHSAPHKDCKSNDVFVVPGDELIAYSEYRGWFSVMYLNPKSSRDFQGWVVGKRLKFIGTEGPQD